MTLNGIMAVIRRYFSEFDSFRGALRKSSRSLSHLLMSSCTVGCRHCQPANSVKALSEAYCMTFVREMLLICCAACSRRYLFALQVKRDLLTGSMPCQDHTAVLLASYIVQCESAAKSRTFVGHSKFR